MTNPMQNDQVPYNPATNEAFKPLAGTEKAAVKKLDAKPQAHLLPAVPADAPSPPLNSTKHGKPSKVYEYRNADGTLRSLVLRYETAEGKTFSNLSWGITKNGSEGWVFKAPAEDRPLYNLDQLIARPDAKVIICEGEKAADAGEAMFPDFVVITTMGGSNAASKTDFSPLAGRTVIISPDNDQPGEKYAREVAQLARAAGAKEVLHLRPQRLAGDALSKGWDLADALAAGWTAESVAAEMAKGDLFEPFETANDNGASVADGMPAGFRLNGKFLERAKPSRDDDADIEWERVCTWLRVAALARDESARGWAYLVQLRDADGNTHEVLVPNADLAGDGTAVIALLKEHGLRAFGVKGGKQAILAAIEGWDTDARVRLVEISGHHGGCFVTPTKVYGSSGKETIRLNARNASATETFRTHGDWETWLELAALCRGNSRLAFAICTAFVGPLLKLVNAESGGFHIHGKAAGGKTTTLLVVCAVWGNALHTWRATDNGLEGIAASHSDMLLVLDELGQASSQVVGKVIYMLANGSGKTRAHANGEARKPKTWRLPFLSTGEITLTEKLGEVGLKAKAGQEIRFMELPSPNLDGDLGMFENLHGYETGHEFANRLKNLAEQVGGLAGDRFLTRLMEDPDAAAEKVRDFCDDFVARHCPKDADGQVFRGFRRIALVAAAGELAAAFGALPWEPGEAAEMVARCGMDWLSQRGGIESAEERESVKQALGMLERFGGSRFDEWTNGEVTDYARDRLGWRRVTDGRTEYFATADGFAELHSGFAKTIAITALIKKGILKPMDNGKTMKSLTVPSHGKKRLYHLVPPQAEDGGDA